jgi:protein-S-isoprenylcysteine O-methyltransferase
MINPLWLALFYFGSEVFISTRLRAKSGSGDTDRGSLRMIWIVVNLSVVSAMLAKRYLPVFDWPFSPLVYWIGLGMFASALALRWYSIAYLGRSFTVNVTVRSNQKVMDSGPYRWIRHPSYLGSLGAFVGLGLCFANYATLVLLSVPTTLVFLHRMRVEEAALVKGLGHPYAEYMKRTKRLLPLVY